MMDRLYNTYLHLYHNNTAIERYWAEILTCTSHKKETIWRFGGTGLVAIGAGLPCGTWQLSINLSFFPSSPLLSSVSIYHFPFYHYVAGLAIAQHHLHSSLLCSPWTLVTSYRTSVPSQELVEKRTFALFPLFFCLLLGVQELYGRLKYENGHIFFKNSIWVYKI